MMRRTFLNVFLLMAFLGSLWINWAIRPHPAQPNREFIPEMFRTARYNAFSSNPNFADGKTLQAPVAGTIPQGFPPLHYNATPEDAIRAGETLHSPVPRAAPSMRPGMAGMMGMMGAMGMMGGGMPGMMGSGLNDQITSQAVERGIAVFSNFCQPCHGATGKGDGLVVLRGYPAPPPLDADHARQMPDGQMFHVLTYGQKNMPAYASQISREDRWNVIAFVRSLQARPQLPPSIQPGIASEAATPRQPEAIPSGGRR